MPPQRKQLPLAKLAAGVREAASSASDAWRTSPPTRMWIRNKANMIRLRISVVLFSNGEASDLGSSTIFADDDTKRTVPNTPQEVITKMGEKSTMLKKFAADTGIVMNQSKEEHQVGFVGPGSATSM